MGSGIIMGVCQNFGYRVPTVKDESMFEVYFGDPLSWETCMFLWDCVSFYIAVIWGCLGQKGLANRT